MGQMFFRPAPSIGAMHGPTRDSLDYGLGYTAGYQARVQEEIASYISAVQTGRKIYDRVLRDLVQLPTAAERQATREGVLRAAHAAELHADGPAYGCPACKEASSAVSEPCPVCGRRMCAVNHPEVEWCDCTGKTPTRMHPRGMSGCSYAVSDRHHSGHYVVPDGGPQGCLDHEVNQLGCEMCGKIRTRYYDRVAGEQQVAEWLERRGVGRTPTPGTVRRGVELDHADALDELAALHGADGR